MSREDESIRTDTACSGMNFGSVVIMVRPEADWGISSTARFSQPSSSILGSTTVSMNFCMNVDLPVRTGPTTPM